ncbi:hypothetical protein THASP1DRAFT_31610, partial [Thamnocephalis sphaerospora]
DADGNVWRRLHPDSLNDDNDNVGPVVLVRTREEELARQQAEAERAARSARGEETKDDVDVESDRGKLFGLNGMIRMWQSLDDASEEELRASLSLWRVDAFHCFLGLILVGIVGFLQALFGPVVFAPTTIFGGARRRGGGRGDSVDSWQLVILAMVVVGVVCALWTIYKSVRQVSQRNLDRLGAHILDVQEAPVQA